MKKSKYKRDKELAEHVEKYLAARKNLQSVRDQTEEAHSSALPTFVRKPFIPRSLTDRSAAYDGAGYNPMLKRLTPLTNFGII